VDEVERGKNRTNSPVKAEVEYPFQVIKPVFGFAKVPRPRSGEEDDPPPMTSVLAVPRPSTGAPDRGRSPKNGNVSLQVAVDAVSCEPVSAKTGK
jgi:hypothetical protein